MNKEINSNMGRGPQYLHHLKPVNSPKKGQKAVQLEQTGFECAIELPKLTSSQSQIEKLPKKNVTVLSGKEGQEITNIAKNAIKYLS